MRSLFVLAVTSTALIFSPVANARDVNMMRFSPSTSISTLDSGSNIDDIVLSRSAALGSSPFAGPLSENATVSNTMRKAFDEAISSTSNSNPRDAIDLDNLPTRNVPLPAWMQSTSQLPINPPLHFPALSGCDGATYQPAWWLSRTAEARRQYYFPTMAAIACEVGVPTLMFDALIAQESGYNPVAISSAGAMGMAQIMPGTARYLGLYVPFDPVSNMRAGARYLKEQLNRFGGRSDLALAAYNAGPRRVEKSWAVPRIRETINYVNVITVNWSRLASFNVTASPAVNRGELAAAVVDSFPYRKATFVNFTSR